MQGIQSYVIETDKVPIQMTESLAPQGNLTVDDLMVRKVLSNLQEQKPIVPSVFRDYTTDDRLYKATRNGQAIADRYKTAVRSIITQHYKHHESFQFLDRTTMTECIQASFDLGITNPLFVGRIILEEVSSHDKTRELWAMIRTQYSRHDIIKTQHILDLYEVSCNQRQILDPIEEYTKPFYQSYQGRSTAHAYVNDKCVKLKQLLDRYDHSAPASDLRNNSKIMSAVTLMLAHVHDKARGRFRLALQYDKELPPNSGWSKLNWNGVTCKTHTDLENYFHSTQKKLLTFAHQVDREEALNTARGTTSKPTSGGGPANQHRRQNQGSRQRKSTTNNDKPKQSQSKNNKSKPKWTPFETDMSKQCTNRLCRKRGLQQHNVGGVTECAHWCTINLRGATCPNTHVNDKDGAHLYRPECQKAVREHLANQKQKPDQAADQKAAVNAVSTSNDTTAEDNQEHTSINYVEIEVGESSGHKLALMLDQGSDVAVLSEDAYKRIKHLCTPTGRNIDVTSLGGTQHRRQFAIPWPRSETTKDPMPFKFIVQDGPYGGDGLLPRTLYSQAGIHTSFKQASFKARPIPNSEATRRGLYNDTHAVLALCQQKQFDAILQEFKELIENDTLTEDILQQLMDRLPVDDHPHGFNLLDALQYLLVIHRAQRDISTTTSDLYRSLLKKILEYAELDKPTPDQAKAHEEALQLLESQRDSLTDPDKLASINNSPAMREVTHRPDIQPDGPPIKGRGIPMKPPIQKIFEDWHELMVKKKLIVAATPAQVQQAKFVLSHIPVLKRGATQPYGVHSYRFVLDMVPANLYIKHRERVKFPTRQEIRDFAKGKTTFSVIDVQKFFWGIPSDYGCLMLHRCKGKYYYYAVVIQGDKTAPAAASRVIMAAIGDIVAKGDALVHVDDIILGTATPEQHVELIALVFIRLIEYGLKINSKLELCRPMVRFLGMLVHKNGVQPDLLRYNQLFLWPKPTTRAEIATFVGFCMFFHTFIKDATVILAPLQNLANGTGPLRDDWQDEHQLAFDEAKAALINATNLHPINYEAPFYVHVDTATSNAIGAVLYQKGPDDTKHPLLFQSRRLTAAERNYSPTDAELMGAYWAITIAFASFIEYSPIILVTDHMNLLQHLDVDTATSKRRRRWALYLRDFNIIDVQHAAGKTFTDADTLSRIKVPLATKPTTQQPESPKPAATTRGNQRQIHTPPSSMNVQAMVLAIQEASASFHPPLAEPLTNAQLRIAQANDPFCQRITNALKDPATASTQDKHIANRSSMTDGVLYYRDFVIRRNENAVIPVLPTSLQPGIIDAFHRSQHGPHRTVSHTATALRAHWYFPNMVATVRRHVNDCEHCSLVNTSGNPIRQGTMSTFQPTAVNQVLSIDIYEISDTAAHREGPNYRYALVSVYSFSRNPVVQPLHTKSAREVATLLAETWSIFGIPAQLRCDLGNEFKAEVLRLCKLFGVQRIPTAKHSPQSNGAVERVNQEFKKKLRSCRLSNPETPWQAFLPAILATMRSTVHSATGFTPYELLGVSTPTPARARTDPTETSIVDFSDDHRNDRVWVQWVQTLQHRQVTALANDIETRDKRLHKMNQSRTPAQFKVGEWIRGVQKNTSKTASQLGDQLRITGVSTNGQVITAQHPTTGRSTQLPITEVVKSTPPTSSTPPLSSTNGSTSTHHGPPAAIAVTRQADGARYIVVSDNVTLGNTHPVIYRNKRPNSAASQAHWTITTNPAPTNTRILETFRFQIKKTGNLVIPRAVRQKYRDYVEIQGRTPSTKGRDTATSNSTSGAGLP